MRKMNELNTKIIEEEALWRKCKDFIAGLKDHETFIKLIARSKKTTKLYIRLVMKSELLPC